MKIKDRIALYFTLISTSMLFAVLCTVYFTFMKFLEADFFERLTDRTMVTAKLYLEADEISRDALNTVRHKPQQATIMRSWLPLNSAIKSPTRT